MCEAFDKEFPLVSCIVTCYQKIPYLFEAVDSVLAQDYPRLELIIADDGSDGFSVEQLRAYINERKASNITNVVICHQEANVGTVRNIRTALEHAAGLYCVNLDGDDVFDHDTVISEMTDYAKSNNLDFLECGKRRCDADLKEIELLPTAEEKRKIGRLNTAKKQYHSFAVLRFLNIGGGSGMLYRKELVEKIGLFDLAYRNWQDGPSLLAYVKQGKTVPVNHEIITIKYRSGGVSNSPYQNTVAFHHLGHDRMCYLRSVTVPDRWNPFFFRRRRFLFYYYWESAKTKKQLLLLLIRFPIMGFRQLRRSAKERRKWKKEI